ncbi:unnamed protein product [Linum tenue]|uniref:Protein BIG GRAIN 1-like B n=1 Tax=Linum tenue TaxID=586396 RepID=A0AAV0HQ54_9ROSI|nr:unnamed protein product [Linum tenue]
MTSQEQLCARTPLHPQRRRTPSFSSSLLDAIYRSIDNEGGEGGNSDSAAAADTYPVVEKQSGGSVFHSVSGEVEYKEPLSSSSSTSLRRAIMVEAWMEEKQSTPSTSKSSSSLETESCSTVRSSASSSSCTPLRTKVFDRAERKKKKVSKKKAETTSGDPSYEEEEEAGFTRTTKLRALKFYSELKKVKQPISPGGRIASFLNSIFSPGGGGGAAKKVKMCSVSAAMEGVTKSSTNSNSSSSASKSCFSSKTPPPPPLNAIRSLNPSTKKRSVRFYPFTVIVDEDSRPCGHKSIYDQEDPGLMPSSKILKRMASLKGGKICNGDSDHGYYGRRSFQKKKNKFAAASTFDYRDYMDEEEDSDGEGSCSSSDLFELDHLSGVRRYSEELPVYETTSFQRNRVIANGFIR